jgi:hypothetical protein
MIWNITDVKYLINGSFAFVFGKGGVEGERARREIKKGSQ